jgi:proliferating cell nuclear antigen
MAEQNSNEFDNRLLHVVIADPSVIQTVVGVMKDILGDITMEFTRDNSMNAKYDDKSSAPVKKDIIGKKNKKLLKKMDNEPDASNVEGCNEDKSNKIVEGGLKIVAINYTRTLLILIKLNAKEFSAFKVSTPTLNVGVNLNYLHKLIKSLNKDDILTIAIDEEDKQTLILDVENEVKNSRTRNKLQTLDINKTSYKIPATKFEVTITMDPNEFHSICKEMSQISEYVEIVCKKNSITFSCKGDCSEKSTTLEATDTNDIKIKFLNPNNKTIIQGIFELKHFVMFSKCSSLCSNIQIYMKNNYPIFIKYTVAKLGHILLGLIPITDANINNNFSDDEDGSDCDD